MAETASATAPSPRKEHSSWSIHVPLIAKHTFVKYVPKISRYTFSTARTFRILADSSLIWGYNLASRESSAARQEFARQAC